MSSLNESQDAPLAGAALYARLFNVDLITAARAIQSLQPSAAPFGIRLLGCMGQQDARALLGMSVPSTVIVDAYTFGR